MIEKSDQPITRPPPFQSTSTTPDISHSGTKLSLLIVIFLTTHAGSKRQSIQDFTLIKINRDGGVEILEVWMPNIRKKHNNRRAVWQRTAEGTNQRNSKETPKENVFFVIRYPYISQEPITWGVQLPSWAYSTAFSRNGLFLDYLFAENRILELTLVIRSMKREEKKWRPHVGTSSYQNYENFAFLLLYSSIPTLQDDEEAKCQRWWRARTQEIAWASCVRVVFISRIFNNGP